MAFSARLCLKKSWYFKICGTFSCKRYCASANYSTFISSPLSKTQSENESFTSSGPEFDWNYLTDSSNIEEIEENIENRKGVGSIAKVITLWQSYQECLATGTRTKKQQYPQDELYHLRQELIKAAKEIPNKTHPDTPIGDETYAKLLSTVGNKRKFKFKPRSVERLGIILDALRTSEVNTSSTAKSYYLKGPFVQLQNALVNYTLDYIKAQGFEQIRVPELIHPSTIEGCGFNAFGERTQVYHLDGVHGQDSLIGTGEIPFAALYMDEVLQQDSLPKRYTTVSQCFRAEAADASSGMVDQGLYRVHEFKKVEMFCLTTNETGKESEQMAEELLAIQSHLFTALGLHYRIMEMPSEDLGAPAYRKIDIEAWMPFKMFWGEISSTSNCTDFQSRRLLLKYQNNRGETNFIHTVNGTACATPRIIKAIAENFQTKSCDIQIPEVLHPYMNGMTVITKPQKPSEMFFTKLKSKKEMEKHSYLEDS